MLPVERDGQTALEAKSFSEGLTDIVYHTDTTLRSGTDTGETTSHNQYANSLGYFPEREQSRLSQAYIQ